ncbi:hypothetical protein SELMODRAFT_181183 [Selaginella moellendorffii]|uniref:Amino acid transporter transmembrane domain-containing protein n=1 Tax=Selaginella moellendorffii TaxID=88036 RepID=D8SN01_SELML|nr:amino acid transporter AVT1B [Selaginella moellendorffii]EFJ14266.1 hypothetical protein SELMODRAFT_181183 [Selaginella moellendorffii]|eukprot:XP_002984621.1 amino acid transporter AVT1B [Selaginella moellendorffii]
MHVPQKGYLPQRQYAAHNSDVDDEEQEEVQECDEEKQDEDEVTLWPQSYRQSIDAYSFLTPPKLSILSPASLTRSFLSSSAGKRSYLQDDEEKDLKSQLLSAQEQDQATSTDTTTLVERKPSIVTIAHGFPREPQDEGCGFTQALLNGMNVLAGVGILTTPYAVKQGGWIGLVLLFSLAVICCYTGIILRKCLESRPGLKTYPDIGQAAFGSIGRLIISIVLYVELYACCVEFLILEGDNLSVLFPGTQLSLFGYTLDSHKLFAILAALFILPTVWLRNLHLLSYVSAGGVVASLIVVFTVFWVGAVDGIGFHETGKFIDIAGLPVSLGLYGFCYSGHAVFPNIYTSMKNKSRYNRVLTISFVLCAGLFGAVAAMGYKMFGDKTRSQVTLNMPKEFVASKIALWTIVINPFTKYALTITPVALSLEELLPINSSRFQQHLASIVIRTLLVASTVVVAISVPFFGFVMAFIGSFLSMAVSLILPCACYMRIRGSKLSLMELTLGIGIMLVGIVCAVGGTLSSLDAIIKQLKN